MTLVADKIKLPFIWKRVYLITDFLLVQTMICNHLYPLNKIFQKHVLGDQYQAEWLHGHRGLFCTTSHPPVFVRSRSSRGSHAGRGPQRESLWHSTPPRRLAGLRTRRLSSQKRLHHGRGPPSTFPSNFSNFQPRSYQFALCEFPWIHLLPPFLI